MSLRMVASIAKVQHFGGLTSRQKSFMNSSDARAATSSSRCARMGLEGGEGRGFGFFFLASRFGLGC